MNVPISDRISDRLPAVLAIFGKAGNLVHHCRGAYAGETNLPLLLEDANGVAQANDSANPSVVDFVAALSKRPLCINGSFDLAER